MLSVLEIVQKTTAFFSSKGVESPRLNAEILIGHALGLKRMQLYLQFERMLTEAELDQIRPLVRRRGHREPLAYVVGETDFHGLRLKTDRRALVPRPETEGLVELVVKACVPPPARILDLGTGSGCSALAFAQAFPEAQVTAVDASEEALALARENAAVTGLAARVQFARSDWYGALPAGAKYDAIVANPPYLTPAETAETQPEVRAFEPVLALTADEEGLAALRVIVAGVSAHLAPGGLLALETGIAHHARVLELLETAGLRERSSHRDLAGRDRYVLARL